MRRLRPVVTRRAGHGIQDAPANGSAPARTRYGEAVGRAAEEGQRRAVAPPHEVAGAVEAGRGAGRRGREVEHGGGGRARERRALEAVDAESAASRSTAAPSWVSDAASKRPRPRPIGTGPLQARPSGDVKAQTDPAGSVDASLRPARTTSAPSCGRRRISGRPARASSANLAVAAHARAPRGSAQ